MKRNKGKQHLALQLPNHKIQNIHFKQETRGITDNSADSVTSNKNNIILEYNWSLHKFIVTVELTCLSPYWFLTLWA